MEIARTGFVLLLLLAPLDPAPAFAAPAAPAPASGPDLPLSGAPLITPELRLFSAALDAIANYARGAPDRCALARTASHAAIEGARKPVWPLRADPDTLHHAVDLAVDRALGAPDPDHLCRGIFSRLTERFRLTDEPDHYHALMLEAVSAMVAAIPEGGAVREPRTAKDGSLVPAADSTRAGLIFDPWLVQERRSPGAEPFEALERERGVRVLRIRSLGPGDAALVENYLGRLGRRESLLVDLRGSGGGDAAEVSRLAAHVGAGGKEIFTWRLEDGASTVVGTGAWRPRLRRVAVLVDSLTAGGGEMLALALLTNRNVLFAGIPTAGLRTVYRAIPMPDGHALVLPVGTLDPAEGRWKSSTRLVPERSAADRPGTGVDEGMEECVRLLEALPRG